MALANEGQHAERLRNYWKRNHALPSMAKLCGAVGISSTTSVFDLVFRLKDPGYVERVEGRAPSKRFFARPLVEQVPAGLPQPAPAEHFEFVTIGDYPVPDPKGTRLLDGDLVGVQKNWPKTGDIVVAVGDGAITVKHLRQRAHGRFFLQAANPAFADILPTGELEIRGAVVVSSARAGGDPLTSHQAHPHRNGEPTRLTAALVRGCRDVPRACICRLVAPGARGHCMREGAKS